MMPGRCSQRYGSQIRQGSANIPLIYLLEHFAHDGSANLVVQKVNGPLAWQRCIWSMQPTFGLLFISENAIGKLLELDRHSMNFAPSIT